MFEISDSDVQFYMYVASKAATRSKAERLKVGAVIVNSDHVMATGYNGTPPKWDNCCEDYCEDGTTVSKPEVIHAELNALFKFIKNGISTKDCALFLTHSPCLDCARAIFLAGITQLYFSEAYRSSAGVEFLEKAGIRITHFAEKI